MCKLLIAVAAILPLSFPAAASAHTWFILNAQTAECVDMVSEGMTSPNDMITELRNEGLVPDVKIEKGTPLGPNDIADVELDFKANNGDPMDIVMFTGLGYCQFILAQEIKEGFVTPPSQLN